MFAGLFGDLGLSSAFLLPGSENLIIALPARIIGESRFRLGPNGVDYTGPLEASVDPTNGTCAR
jgi:hypothetical protein